MLSPFKTARYGWKLAQTSSRPLIVSTRGYATAEPDLKSTLKEVIPEKRELLKQVKARGDEVIGNVTISSVIGGMRGLKAMV
ncbi:hypothetical protein F66182_15159, partial [Fusarium sp. NRRL 66182]